MDSSNRWTPINKLYESPDGSGFNSYQKVVDFLSKKWKSRILSLWEECGYLQGVIYLIKKL